MPSYFLLWLCAGGWGKLVSVVTFYSDHTSSNPAEDYIFSVKFVFERTKINKRDRGWPISKLLALANVELIFWGTPTKLNPKQCCESTSSFAFELDSVKVCLSIKAFRFVRLNLSLLWSVWADWVIYWTLCKLLKPLATISMPKLPTFLGNFCKGVKICHFSGEIIFEQLL